MTYSWSYTSGSSDTPLLGLTIGDLFDQTVARYPDNEALVVRHQDIRYTYRQLQAQVDRCARALMALGAARGERLGIWAPNCAEWTIVQLASAKLGVILVNINPAYRLHEVEYALNQSGCAYLVIAPQFKTSNYSQMVYDLAPELATAQPGQLRAARLPDLRAVVRLGTDPAPGMLTWDELLQMAMQAGEVELLARQAELQFDDPINIQYTSGTTGAPKGATLSHHNVLNNAYFTGKLQRFTDQDRVVAPVPLYHIFGCVLVNLACITHGATMIYPSNSFDPAATLEAVQAERATALYGVPTMFIAELSLPEFSSYDLRSLRTGLIGGAPCPVEVMKQIKTLMHIDEIEIIYGMTETGPLSFQTRIGTSLEKQVGTVGQVHPHVEVKIVDPDSGQLVPVGTSGELCTRGYSVMLGYWNNADATRQAIDSAHWMHTGDLAVMDAEGYVNIIGRSQRYDHPRR